MLSGSGLAQHRRLQHLLAPLPEAGLKATFGLSAKLGDELARKLLGQVLHPRLPRALFGLDQLATSFDPEALSPDFDLGQVREAVADVMGALPERQPP